MILEKNHRLDHKTVKLNYVVIVHLSLQEASKKVLWMREYWDPQRASGAGGICRRGQPIRQIPFTTQFSSLSFRREPHWLQEEANQYQRSFRK